MYFDRYRQKLNQFGSIVLDFSSAERVFIRLIAELAMIEDDTATLCIRHSGRKQISFTVKRDPAVQYEWDEFRKGPLSAVLCSSAGVSSEGELQGTITLVRQENGIKAEPMT